MNRFSGCLGLAVVALGLLASAAPAQAQERPFRGGGTGRLDNNVSNFAALFSPTELPLLGRTGVYIEVDTDWLVFDSAAPVPVFGRVLFVSHSDNLFAFFDAEFDPATGIMAGTLTFQSGETTGRFADATGSASLLIVFDDWTGPLGDPRFGFVIDETIDY